MTLRSPIRHSSTSSHPQTPPITFNNHLVVEKIMEIAVRNSAPGWASQANQNPGNTPSLRSHVNALPNLSKLPSWARDCLRSPLDPRTRTLQLKIDNDSRSAEIGTWRKLGAIRRTENIDPPTQKPANVIAERQWVLGYFSGSFSKTTTISWVQATEAFNQQFSKKLLWGELAALMASSSDESPSVQISLPGYDANSTPTPIATHPSDIEPRHSGQEEMVIGDDPPNRKQSLLTLMEIAWLIAYITSHGLFIGRAPDQVWEQAAAAYQQEFGLIGFRDTLPKKLSKTEFLSQMKKFPDYEGDSPEHGESAPDRASHVKKRGWQRSSYSSAQINWLLAYGQPPQEANWNKITREFNQNFEDWRHLYPLYCKWLTIATPPKYRSAESSSKPTPLRAGVSFSAQIIAANARNEEAMFTIGQTEWLLNMAPIFSESNGIMDWGEIKKNFKSEFGVSKAIGSLYSQWRYITLSMNAPKM